MQRMRFFSAAEKTWLPIPVEHQLRAVNVQQGNETSVMEHYRRFLAFRKTASGLRQGPRSSSAVMAQVLRLLP